MVQVAGMSYVAWTGVHVGDRTEEVFSGKTNAACGGRIDLVNRGAMGGHFVVWVGIRIKITIRIRNGVGHGPSPIFRTLNIVLTGCGGWKEKVIVYRGRCSIP